MESTKMQKLHIWLWSSGIIFLWMGSAYFLSEVLSKKPNPEALAPTTSDLATIFFGASSLALIIFSLLLAMAAIIEWQSLKRDVRKEIELADAAEKRMTRLEKELKGRMHTVTGLVIGSLHSDPLAEQQDPRDKDYLGEAIYYSQKGYKILKEIEGNGKYMALNNMLYYSCLLGNESRRDVFLAQAREIKEISEKYEDSQYIAPYLMTFCRVVLTFGSDSDLAELKLARDRAESLLEMNLTSLQRKEAAMLAASLDRKLIAAVRPAASPS